MAKVITKEDVAASNAKAADKATKAETKRCVSAVRDLSAGDFESASKFKAAVIAAIKE